MSEQERSAYAIGYAAQWWTAVVVAILLVAIAGIQAVGPEELAIPPVAFRWLAIVSGCLVFAQALLPKVQAVPIKNYDEVKAAEAIDKIEAPSFGPEFVDAVAEALLRKRAEDLERRYPLAKVAPHG